MSTRISPRIMANMGFHGKDKVEDFVINNQVVFPERILEIWPELVGKRIFVSESRKDRVVWKSRTGKVSVFKSSTVWNDFRESCPHVHWKHLVWFSNSIPKHSFILWLAVRGKLLTQDRMHYWQISGNSSCGFCNTQRDSASHLFFECPFSQEVRDHFLHLEVDIPNHLAWCDLVDHVSQNWKGKSLVHIINKLTLGSLVYFIWQERNLRIFQNQHRSSRQVIKCIQDTVRMKIMGLKIRNSNRVFRSLRLWNISWETSLNHNFLNVLGLPGAL